MGLFDWFFNLFRPAAGESPADVADRLHRFADRFRNAGDFGAEQTAREAAREAREAPDTAAAVAIEHAFLRSQGLDANGRPPRPFRGQAAGGAEYVRYGDRARAGGSRAWRYHNPGYVRCSHRSSSYGAIGCDGEYAIFPDERTGARALAHTLRDEYPDRPLGEALREHLPPEANPSAVLDALRRAGADVTAGVASVPFEQLEGAADACRGADGWQPGEVLDHETSAGEWADVWSGPSGGGDSGPSGSTDTGGSDDRHTDNS